MSGDFDRKTLDAWERGQRDELEREGSEDADLNWLRRFGAACRVVRRAEPSSDLTRRLRQLAPDRDVTVSESAIKGALRILTAGSAEFAAVGLRGQAAGDQFIAEGSDMAVCLSVTEGETNQKRRIDGQILQKERHDQSRSVLIEPSHGAGDLFLVYADDLGEFRVDGVPAGDYDVYVECGEIEMHIPGFTVS